ncbi:MAG: metallophosphoesterase [Chlamydiia bacterium]|nr:metallophosphoesterase [Chlamydiia bacterium]
MTVWALADLHLAISKTDKTMEVFGPRWANYQNRIREQWLELVSPKDLVLLPGDLSWAMHLDEAVLDLQWIDALPGTKVMIRGNHDYWWGSMSKLEKACPPSIHPLHNNAFDWEDISIAGARLWDTEEFDFDAYIDYIPNQKQVNPKPAVDAEERRRSDAKIFERELQRLELSLKQLNPKAKTKIAMTHYPPVSATLEPSRAAALLEKYGVDLCCFGHLHNTKLDIPMFGEARGVRYVLCSADAIAMRPIQVL